MRDVDGNSTGFTREVVLILEPQGFEEIRRTSIGSSGNLFRVTDVTDRACEDCLDVG